MRGAHRTIARTQPRQKALTKRKIVGGRWRNRVASLLPKSVGTRGRRRNFSLSQYREMGPALRGPGRPRSGKPPGRTGKRVKPKKPHPYWSQGARYRKPANRPRKRAGNKRR